MDRQCYCFYICSSSLRTYYHRKYDGETVLLFLQLFPISQNLLSQKIRWRDSVIVFIVVSHLLEPIITENTMERQCYRFYSCSPSLRTYYHRKYDGETVLLFLQLFPTHEFSLSYKFSLQYVELSSFCNHTFRARCCLCGFHMLKIPL